MSEETSEPQGEAKEKKVFTVSASSLDTIDTCGQLFEYSKVKKLRPIRKKRALDYGGLMHFMLYAYRFGQIRDPKEHHLEHPYAVLLGRPLAELRSIASSIGRLKSFKTDLSAEDREKCIETFNNYVTFYIPRDKFKILEVEQPFTKILHEDDDYIIAYNGIMDMLIYDEDWGQVPYDTKTGGRDWFRADTENQLQGSCWAFNSSKFVIDKILDVKELPFRRKIYSYMDEHLEEWRIDAVRTAMKGISYIENNFYPRHRSSCSKYNGCFFLDACKVNPSSRQFKLDSFFVTDEHEFDLYGKDEQIPEILAQLDLK